MKNSEEITDLQKVDSPPPATPSSNDQYRILNYFKEHTGFFVACVSALIAIMSFVVQFAISRMNFAYLEYWDIPTLYANTNNQNEFYLVVCTLLYTLVLMLIHALLSKTSSAYRNYNRLQSTIYQQIRHAKKLRRRLRKELKTCSKLLDKLSLEEKECDEVKKIQKDIEKATEDSISLQDSIYVATRSRKAVRIQIVLNVGLSIVVSFFLGCLFALFSKSTITMDDILKSAKLIILIILLDLLLYFLPAYLSTRCTKKQYTNMDISSFVEEMNSDKMLAFPIDNVAEKGLTPIFSDKRIKQAVAQVILVTTLILFLMPTIGTQSAELKKEFSIYREDSKTYAIVYTSGTTVFMEEAIIEDKTIIIKTSKQRIVTTNDLSYETTAFKNISVIRTECD